VCVCVCVCSCICNTMVAMRGTLVHDRAAYNAGLRQDGSMTRFHSTRSSRVHTRTHSRPCIQLARAPTSFSPQVGPWLQAGGTGLDCAWDYFNQPKVAEAIKASGVPRESIFITTKVRRCAPTTPPISCWPKRGCLSTVLSHSLHAKSRSSDHGTLTSTASTLPLRTTRRSQAVATRWRRSRKI
jgi:hypothetical protein